jgi:type II secretory pathway pseudopilin PulG
MRPSPPRRAGFGLIVMLVALAIVAILLGSITFQIVINRKALARHENRLQALWLARAGLDIAAAKLLAADYRGETIELIPAGTVRIDVRQEKENFHVSSEATYPANSAEPVVREVSRIYHRVTEGKRTRLEASADDE